MAKKDIVVDNATLDSENNSLTLSFTTYDEENTNVPKRIAIDNQTTFVCKNEESINATKIDIESSDYTTESAGGYYAYHVDKTIDLTDKVLLTSTTDIMYVFIYSKDSEEEYLEAVIPVYDEKNLYEIAYKTISQDFKTCDCNHNDYLASANSIILINGIEYSLIIGDYRQANKYWQILHTSSITNNSCKCHS